MIKIKLDEGNDSKILYLVMKEHYFEKEVIINPETKEKSVPSLSKGNLIKIVMVSGEKNELTYKLQHAKGRDIIIINQKPEIHIL